MSTIINLPLLSASLATGAKYLASNLRIVQLANNKYGAIEQSYLESIENTYSPYPLVWGKDLYGRNIIVPVTIKGEADTMYFSEAVVNISRDRNIVATPVLNGKGTVKEMITEGDLNLSISLAVVSTSDDGDYDGKSIRQTDQYPYIGVERLRKLLDEPNRLNIVSDFLKLFDLDGGDFGIVIKSYSINQETHTNRQVFEIQAISDYNYNLLIEE